MLESKVVQEAFCIRPGRSSLRHAPNRMPAPLIKDHSLPRFLPWIPAITMMLVSLISYIDRNTLAVLAPTIQSDAGMNNASYGWVLTAFSIAYMIGNPVWGWLLDRYGLRAGMTAAVAFWTAASVAHAFANDFWSFAIARAALGFGEGATFPGGLRAVMQSLPAHHRARGVALAYSGGSAGAIVAPLIVTPIAERWGWHGAFLFTGVIGVAWLVLWQLVGLRADMRHTMPAKANGSANGPQIVHSATWSYMFAYALGGLPLAFILYFSAKFLNVAFDISQSDLKNLLWIPPLGWEVGYFFWGWVSDRAHRSSRDALAVERMLFLLLAALSLPLAAVPFCHSLSVVMSLLFLAMVMSAGFIVVAISYATNIYSTESSGRIAGFGAGAWAAVGAAMFPRFGRLFDDQQIPVAFALAAVIPSVGCALWLLLSGTKKRTTVREEVAKLGDHDVDGTQA